MSYQDLGDVLAVSDGTYTEDLVNVNLHISDDILRWNGYLYRAESISDADEGFNCCSGIEYEVYSTSTCKFGSQYKSGVYWQNGCLTVNTKSQKSASAVNYTGRSVRFGGCPLHDCRSGCRYKRLSNKDVRRATCLS